MCREAAPGLVQAYHCYHSMGVEFVSVSDIPRAAVQEFVSEFDIPWACGYGASMAAVARFGAYCPARRSTPDRPAFEVSPTVFLIGPDGRVLWHDDQARVKHMDAEEWAAELDAAIREHLSP